MAFSYSHDNMSGLILIEHDTFQDNRGYYKKIFDHADFCKEGIKEYFVEEEMVISAMNVLRGLYFRLPPEAQAKIVMVHQGSILDVVVDLRKESPNYRQWSAIEMTGRDHRSLYIPKGFAHGFLALENDTCVFCRHSARRSEEHERGIRWNDPAVGIVWPIASPRLSNRDANIPFLGEWKNNPF